MNRLNDDKQPITKQDLKDFERSLVFKVGLMIVVWVAVVTAIYAYLR